MELPSLSAEQQSIIDAVVGGKNVIVDAVAGCGKTTTSLHIAKARENTRCLLLTYNANLKIETRRKVESYCIDNLEIHSYHSFAVKYFDYPCYDDFRLRRMLDSRKPPVHEIHFDLIVLDEQQDMKPLFFELVQRILEHNANPDAQVCLFGDVNQNIYSYQGSSERFLTEADAIIPSCRDWAKLSINTTFRVTRDVAEFVNNALLRQPRLQAHKEGPSVDYVVCNPYDPKEVLKRIRGFLQQGYRYDDIFVLAPSVRSKKVPIRKLENRCIQARIPCFVPMDDEGKVDEDIMRGKVVFTTFHQSKGLERKIVFVYCMDESYYWYARNASRTECPNPIYVATTRALEHLVVIHGQHNDFLPFIDREQLPRHCTMHGYPSPKERSNSPRPQTLVTPVTELVKQLDVSGVMVAMGKLKYRELHPVLRTDVCLPSKVASEVSFEDVTTINGTAIPAFFEYLTNRSCRLYESVTSYVDDLGPEHKQRIDEILCSNQLTISDLLFLATINEARVSGYNYKKNQLRKFDWLDRDDTLRRILRIMYKRVGNPQGPRFYEVGVSKGIEETNVRIVGIMDCVDEATKTIWEFKTVQYLSEVHILQLAMYAYLTRSSYPGYTYRLLNITTGQVLELEEMDIDEVGDAILKTLKLS
jgi:hypothetical protein